MTPKDARAIRLGAVVLVAATLGFRVIPHLTRAVRGSLATLEARRELLHRSVSDLQSLPALEDSAKVLTKAMVALAPRLLSGHGDAEALAELQGHLTHLAVENRIRFDRLDPVEDTTATGSLRRLTVDAVFEGDVRGVAGLLAALAGDVMLIVPERIRVVAADPESSPRQPEALRVELRLTAWALRREAA